MAENRSFRKELLQGMEDIESLKTVLTDINADPKQQGVWDKRVIEMLLHACDYLSANVRILKDRLVS